jgi:hypothetical protein
MTHVWKCHIEYHKTNPKELKGGTYDLRMFLGVNENVLQTQIMKIDSELFGLSARTLQERD